MSPDDHNDPLGQSFDAPPAGSPRSAAPRSRGAGAGRVAALVLAAGLGSASLSSAGMYLAVSLARQPVAATATAGGSPAIAHQIDLTRSDAIVRVASQVKASVVTIIATGTVNVSPVSVPSTGAGSGFIVSAAGLILTNYHVIAGASALTVTLDDTRELPAKVVAADAPHDLALIAVQAAGLVPVPLGDSSSLQVGQLAIAIGSPLGTYTDSVTQGIVSGLNRSVTVEDQVTQTREVLSGLIQTDAAVNPGNSGGPLLDAGGAVVGIITASASDAQEMGFAVPINQAKSMIAGAKK